MSLAITLTEQNFEQEVLQSPVPVFVDFWAPWCGPCQTMGPIVEELAASMNPAQIKIGKVNVDENSMIAGTYNILSIPTFMIFKGGVMIAQVAGGMPKEQLQAFIEKTIQA